MRPTLTFLALAAAVAAQDTFTRSTTTIPGAPPEDEPGPPIWANTKGATTINGTPYPVGGTGTTTVWDLTGTPGGIATSVAGEGTGTGTDAPATTTAAGSGSTPTAASSPPPATHSGSAAPPASAASSQSAASASASASLPASSVPSGAPSPALGGTLLAFVLLVAAVVA